ncbi:nuclear transport factor 2 family protein [Streptomyces galbus]|uniref:Nuclear transport factor 2 family protein n=1 Tax=Streptomyces galbus TaxID=33898 RepID=A0ABX1IRY7_STRGB|nr:nuclear transport factor 2 family protein [Streptomyces galbus]NKQ28400.1 nuclear transport factor 2 family protein [Streptomyces galbus]
MDPTVRTSRAEARQLLDPEFVEVGASGRRWSHEQVLAALPEMPWWPSEVCRWAASSA